MKKEKKFSMKIFVVVVLCSKLSGRKIFQPQPLYLSFSFFYDDHSTTNDKKNMARSKANCCSCCCMCISDHWIMCVVCVCVWVEWISRLLLLLLLLSIYIVVFQSFFFLPSFGHLMMIHWAHNYNHKLVLYSVSAFLLLLLSLFDFEEFFF